MTLPMPSRSETRTTLAERYVEAPPTPMYRLVRFVGRGVRVVLPRLGAAILTIVYVAWIVLVWSVIGLVLVGAVRLVWSAAEWIGRAF